MKKTRALKPINDELTEMGSEWKKPVTKNIF